ncbi:serine phosphatase RsbU (regulator of sigma subunit) [Silvibacterium bohemicum]|uniref:Serine phosphatase RsbU (Regulator of sigma subunit) n=1 Tax=Silvibacterium bohemicum TaxID=1577686 RepID=A0A841JTD4_9BACT|nr:PP2C family protein-serine/threonine phosphatase [Silvibacterium bohemicum]MBB6144586.1 serine phosphatase RsbU (regulator of sigma subunit) [Silvibacterium bohemicum]
MPKANDQKKVLGNFSLLGFQLVLAAVSVSVWAVEWILHARGTLVGVLLGTFITGNVLIFAISATRPVYVKRPRPWNWVVYLLLLMCAGLAGDLLSEVPIYLLLHPPVSFWQEFIGGLPFAMLVTLIVGSLIFAFDDSQARLKAQNEKLQSQVHLGLIEKQAHLSELEQAGEIQMHLLPRETPQLRGFQIACAWQPAKSVSGDYFDVFPVGADKMAVCIADVSGKGMAAALLMANLQASVKAFARDNPSAGAMCARLNAALSDNIAPGRFVTLFYGVLDANTRVMQYENAGHCLPLLVHADGTVDFPAAYSGVLGLFSHWTYSDRDQQLKTGDTLLLLTDGVLEAADEAEEEFGYQRLIQSVVASRASGAHGIRQQVLDDVTAFCHGQFQDDASLIVISVL